MPPPEVHCASPPALAPRRAPGRVRRLAHCDNTNGPDRRHANPDAAPLLDAAAKADLGAALTALSLAARSGRVGSRRAEWHSG